MHPLFIINSSAYAQQVAVVTHYISFHLSNSPPVWDMQEWSTVMTVVHKRSIGILSFYIAVNILD